jgi:hypothetical protein
LYLKQGLGTGLESGGGLGNKVFLKALYFPLKASFPSIVGIRPYDDGLVYDIALKIDLGSVFSRNKF